jgi:endonuclease/exonuclease/phosphatase family metal-dependent hydrolase
MKIISVNIEWDKHHDKVLPFIKKEKPDVLCLQEVFYDDISKYEEVTGKKSFFKPACYFPTYESGGKESKLFGSAIFADDFTLKDFMYIVGDENNIPHFSKAKIPEIERNNTNVVLLWADVKFKEEIFRIATTHFTWTPNGKFTKYQREDIEKLVLVLKNKLKEFVLVGDLNAPRKSGSFEMLSKEFKDNIPENYDSSLDPEIHRLKGSPDILKMVDGFLLHLLTKQAE